jgi:hypothetical protein
VSSAAPANTIERQRSVSSPTERARSSPEASTLSEGPARIASRVPSSTAGNASQGCCAADRSPASQNTIPRNWSPLASDSCSVTTAPQVEATITPVSSSRVAPWPRPIVHTRAMAASAPPAAADCSATKPAPARIASSARRSSFQRNAPDAAMAMTSSAASTAGAWMNVIATTAIR